MVKGMIKKYPRRFITVLAVLLLIAVFGIVSNYDFLSSANNGFLENDTVELLYDIYGEGLEFKDNGDAYFRQGSELFKLNEKIPLHNISDKVVLSIDSERYSPEDTVTLKIENNGYDAVRFYSGEYLLQLQDDSGWYTIDANDRGEFIACGEGESYELEIPLGSIEGEKGDKVALIKGRYRICKELMLHSNRNENTSAFWFACEFEVK